MIRVWAVRSERFASKLIRFGLKQDASHLASGISGFVFHSSIHGVEKLAHDAFWYGKYPNTIARFVELPATLEQEKLIAEKLTPYYEQGYDWKAFAYFSWRCLLRLTLRIPLPKKGTDNAEEFLCVEALYIFLEIYSEVTGRTFALPGKELGVMSPNDCVDWISACLNVPVLH